MTRRRCPNRPRTLRRSRRPDRRSSPRRGDRPGPARGLRPLSARDAWGRAASVPSTSATILSSTGRSPSKCYTAERARRRVEDGPALQEARRLAQLRHPGIVAVHDVGVQEGHVYIVSLRQVRDDEPQPPRQLVGGIPPELETACLKARRSGSRTATPPQRTSPRTCARVLQTTAEASGSRRMPVGTPARDSRVATPGTTGPGAFRQGAARGVGRTATWLVGRPAAMKPTSRWPPSTARTPKASRHRISWTPRRN